MYKQCVKSQRILQKYFSKFWRGRSCQSPIIKLNIFFPNYINLSLIFYELFFYFFMNNNKRSKMSLTLIDVTLINVHFSKQIIVHVKYLCKLPVTPTFRHTEHSKKCHQLGVNRNHSSVYIKIPQPEILAQCDQVKPINLLIGGHLSVPRRSLTQTILASSAARFSVHKVDHLY